MSNLYPLKPANFKIARYLEPVKAFVVPCYTYSEREKSEEYWVDFQNMFYYFMGEEDENGLVEGKKYWVISPYKPQNVVITKENSNLVKWVVEFATDTDDVDYEWDFKEHKPKK